MATLHDIIRKSQEELSAHGIDNSVLDSRLLIAHALKCDRSDLLTQADRSLSIEEVATIHSLIVRRIKREPVSRILGLREFWGLPFGLNEATLDPRPDSETIIETALKSAPPPTRILDLGTGSGCLLLALLHEWSQATGLGVDIAPRAVEQARINAERLVLLNRATFRVNNWLENVDEMFDVIVCNPPYIASNDIPTLMPEVREYDPMAALDGGTDGLDFYHLLAPQLPQRLNADGWAFFEVGQGQAADVYSLFQQAGLKNICISSDLGGIERCVAGKK